ncbi:uncharacterized protein LOC127260654 [Andrographis paniculata]|uniref:uncharacterized protein LOC127260654 n=1 Tax=Andrographis paniculata TaxID=175694 RepID=UPI0021E75468|nr:uncharacterized protein LOC127260654 [Andrographis paniculata]
MAGEGESRQPPPAEAEAQLFGLLSTLLEQVESLTNQEEVELRAKIETLGMEVRKLPSTSAKHLNEMEIAKELDKLSDKLDDVDELISSTMAEDPQVRTLLSSTADVWLPVITATSDERRNFTPVVDKGSHESNGQASD